MAETFLSLLLIVVVTLVLLLLISKLGVDAQLQQILRIAIVGIAIIVVVFRFLLPLV